MIESIVNRLDTNVFETFAAMMSVWQHKDPYALP